MRAFAAMHEVTDAETGETRPATPSDHFPPSALENAPDLTPDGEGPRRLPRAARARLNQLLRGIGGPEYIASLLLGYTGEEQEAAGAVLYEQPVFPGGWIGHAAAAERRPGDLRRRHRRRRVEQMSLDVSAFLMWAAEPQMMARKAAGLTAVLFLIVL